MINIRIVILFCGCWLCTAVPDVFGMGEHAPDSTDQQVAEDTESQQTKPASPVAIRTSMGLNGTVQVITSQNRTYYISQSIGQASITGTHTNTGYTLRQGFQQPLKNQPGRLHKADHLLHVNVYPNPFHQSISIIFNENLTRKVHIAISDLAGRSVFVRTYEPAQQIEIAPGHLPHGVYNLRITSGHKFQITKLIKH